MGHAEVASLLIAQGAEVRDADQLLHDVAAQGHVDSARLLIALGANVNPKRGHGPLRVAANSSVGRLLLAHGASVTATDDPGQTPLHRMAFGNAEVAKLLLK